MKWQYWFVFLLLTISSAYSFPVYHNGEFRQEGKLATSEPYTLSTFLPPVDHWYSLEISSKIAAMQILNDGELSLESFFLKETDDGSITLTAPGIQIESLVSLDFYSDPPVELLTIWIPFDSSFMQRRIEAVSNHFGIKTMVEIHPDPSADLYTRQLNVEKKPDIILFPVSASQDFPESENESFPILFSSSYSIIKKETDKPVLYPLNDKLLSELILRQAVKRNSDPMRLFFSSLKDLSDRQLISFCREAGDIVSPINLSETHNGIPVQSLHRDLQELEIDYALYFPDNRLSASIFCSELLGNSFKQNIPESSGFKLSNREKLAGKDLAYLKEMVPSSLYHPAWESTLFLYINNLIPLDEALDKIK